jgi:hypothetical protein
MYSRLRWWMSLAVVGLCAGSIIPVGAQVRDSAVITAENIQHLAPVAAIDFAGLPEQAGQIVNGRVFTSSDGRLYAVVNRDGQVVFLDEAGSVLGVTDRMMTDDGFPATFIDGAFDPSGQRFAALHSGGTAYHVTITAISGGQAALTVSSEDKPVSIWLDEETAWLEVVPANAHSDPYLLQLPKSISSDTEPVMKLFAPAQDEQAVARIGRLPPPLAVTATESGHVSRWDLSQGKLTAEAQVDAVPIYGAMTPDGRYLVWRDPASVTLHLLDFETGEDGIVTPLAGLYIPFILLTAQADVVIGVHVNDEPAVVGWETATGRLHWLGQYRQCQRPPDMVIFSNDRTTLVIGCDSGLEIWRAVEPVEVNE